MTRPPESDAQLVGILWMLLLDGTLPPGPQPRIPAVFSRAGPEDAWELAQAMGRDDSALVMQRFGLGKHGYIARVDSKIVSYGWITFDVERIGELRLTLRLKQGEAYIWDCATLPAWRGQRLYPALLAHMLRALQNNGLRRAWIGMDADNLPSQVGAALAGFQPVLDVLLAGTPPRKLISRGRPGIPPQDVLDAHNAMFGDHDK